MSAMDAGKVYVLQEVDGKGLGAVAITKIAKGTRILSESPLLRVPREVPSKDEWDTALSKEIAALGDDQRQAFFSLYDAFEDEATREHGIVRTNALPNARHTWNKDLQRLNIHAIRDIDKGEEITTMYIAERANRAARQLVLQRDFRFTCACQLCSLPEPQRCLSDARLDEMLRLDGSVNDHRQLVTSPLQCLHDARELLSLCEEELEGIDDGTVACAYYDAFEIAIFNSDVARAAVLIGRAATARAVLEGEDSPAVREYREIGDVPSGLSAEEFSAWLWRETDPAPTQTSPQAADQYADFRNDAMFPCFDELPGENDLDLDFYESTNGVSYRPSMHWCFIAEIVEIERFMRFRLVVEDKARNQIPVAFYTSHRGGELDPLCLEKGYTVAVLYGEQHGFLDMSVGIRHENPASLKIFRVSLEGLLSLSDRVQQYATVVEGARTCQACGRTAETLKMCARCTFFWYCDKECQTRAWKEKGHKGDCKLLKDPDLQGLLRLPQDGFRQVHEFSGR
ncbi:hypothetical protein C8A05DRAFT_43156 [Staphylotrichum tortipilum]|uniref:MYND-type zinc finger protein samB n=1 Tax=Staphylotrichum tortipilum TaxID=2831512 RepID=A0AAN6MNT0_9PEZI|nr:hypothetical protein C8A05DRAFT_43156 [Staphylotrichum longicolle]